MPIADLQWDAEKDILDVDLKKKKVSKKKSVKEKIAVNVIVTRDSKGKISHIRILNLMQDM